jgi:hypothetical protein
MTDIKLLIIANNGIHPMVLKFGSAPTSATDGIPLDGASTAGGQGGALILGIEDEPGGDCVPVDAIYGMSAAGTTFSVTQQDGAHFVIPYLNRHGFA